MTYYYPNQKDKRMIYRISDKTYYSKDLEQEIINRGDTLGRIEEERRSNTTINIQ
jgi:hypothetical protein